MSVSFDFHGAALEARPSGALFWPARGWLMVADLHLGKSERMARRGGPLLPPYEVRATLDRLEAEVSATRPGFIVSLGDGFDDNAARAALPDDVCQRLHHIASGRDWVWVSGNHDPADLHADDHRLPGNIVSEITGAVALRHAAGDGPDISGHYHPSLRLAGQRFRCFLIGADHLILPAFGAYTGGLSVDDPALRAIVPQGIALACGTRLFKVPVGHMKKAGMR